MAFLELVLIRHAQSTWNQQRRMQGWGDDALTTIGQDQAKRLAKRLQAEFQAPTHIYSSPLRRSRQTTDILLSQIEPIPVEYADELKEFQNGIFEGLTWAEAKALYPDLCASLEASLDWLPIPQAESLREGRDRARRFLQHLLTHHHNGDRIWVISHSWLLQQLIAELLGCDRSWGISICNTALFEFWLDQSRWHETNQNPSQNRWNTTLWQIRHFNDCQHLHTTELH
ncbi:histidine phosphatase family protein [Oscillatoria sp. FACHB-1407]|uniref:histidine phosphatase family protein n=1 Tax=Oscillatoria sp. FACHB-1407 TaxID=2692847 RepID=UPI001A7EFE49|nr:histidine phosphatase family protein [Oscillatoria sp. FACHB-1407]